jgi:hypothetical protein
LRIVDGRAIRVRGITVIAMALSALTLSGCDLRPNADESEPVAEEVGVHHGLCWPVFDSDVISTSMNQNGTVLYIAESEPRGWPDDRGWGSGDRALNALKMPERQQRYIARTWDAVEHFVPFVPTPLPGTVEAPEGEPITEHMREVEIAPNADRFVVGVALLDRLQVTAKLYSGEVPPSGSHELAPEDGLAPVPVNNFGAGEYVRMFRVSPDGSKVATIVGVGGELRIFDFLANQLMRYEIQSGRTVVINDMPTGEPYEAAVATAGTLFMSWSPDSTRLALARRASAGNASVSVFDVATGELTHVLGLSNVTAPHVAWSSDGGSLFVLYTPIDSAGIFGDSQFVRVAAEQDGGELGAAAMPRPPFFRTEPANLVNFGNDEHFLFTWEGGLWRLDAPGGQPAQAEFQKVTPDSLQVIYNRPAVSLDNDLAAFLAGDRGGQHAGFATHLTEACPDPSEEERNTR